MGGSAEPLRPHRRHRALLVLVACAALGVRAVAPGEGGLLSDAAALSDVDRALAALYDFDLPGARQAVEAVAAGHPDHPAVSLLEALALWWEALASPFDTSRDDALGEALDETLARCDRLETSDGAADAPFFRAVAWALRARLKALRGSWVAAAWDGRRAYALVRRIDAIDPDDPDVALGTGLYDYFAAVLPQRHPVFRTLQPFFPRGDRERGLAALERAMREGRFAAGEAAYFLLQIHLAFEGDPARALELARWLRARYPGNPVFHLEEGRALAALGAWGQAGGVFQEVLARRAAERPGYGAYQGLLGWYHTGRAAEAGGRLRDAVARFRNAERDALESAPRSLYRTLAWLHRGLVHRALGEEAAARAAFLQVAGLPDAAGAHRRARAELRTLAGSGAASGP